MEQVSKVSTPERERCLRVSFSLFMALLIQHLNGILHLCEVESCEDSANGFGDDLLLGQLWLSMRAHCVNASVGSLQLGQELLEQLVVTSPSKLRSISCIDIQSFIKRGQFLVFVVAYGVPLVFSVSCASKNQIVDHRHNHMLKSFQRFCKVSFFNSLLQPL